MVDAPVHARGFMQCFSVCILECKPGIYLWGSSPGGPLLQQLSNAGPDSRQHFPLVPQGRPLVL